MKTALAIATMTMTLLLGVGLVRADSATGLLRVAVQNPPPQAAIFIDDAGLLDPSGKQLYTPQTVTLPVGRHFLLLKTDGNLTKGMYFSIAPGTTTTLSLQPR